MTLPPFIETNTIINEFNDILNKAINKERIEFVQRKIKSKILGKEFNELFEIYDLEVENIYDLNDELKEISNDIEIINKEKIKKVKKKKGINKYLELEAEYSGSENEDEENSLDEVFSDFMNESEIIEDEDEEFRIENNIKNEAEKIKELRKNILKRREQIKKIEEIDIKSSSSTNTEEDDDLELNYLNEDINNSIESESDSVY